MIGMIALVLSLSGAQIDYNSVPCKLVVPGEITQSGKDATSRFCFSDHYSNSSSILYAWRYSFAQTNGEINPFIVTSVAMYLCETSTILLVMNNGKYKENIMVDTLHDGDLRKLALYKHCKDRK